MSEISVLDLVGATLGMMAVMVNVVAVANAMALTLRARLIAAAVAGAWVGLSLSLAAAGALTFSQRQPIPLVGVFFALPLVTFGICWVVIPRFREAVLALPPSLLIGLNSFRVSYAVQYFFVLMKEISCSFTNFLFQFTVHFFF